MELGVKENQLSATLRFFLYSALLLFEAPVQLPTYCVHSSQGFLQSLIAPSLVALPVGTGAENPICKRLQVFVQQPLAPTDVEQITTENAWFGPARSHTSGAQSFSETMPLAAVTPLGA